jgi:Mn2+/Fe2+ NRAMP family transporter
MFLVSLRFISRHGWLGASGLQTDVLHEQGRDDSEAGDEEYELVNRRLTTAAATLVVALIVSLNIFLLYRTFFA